MSDIGFFSGSLVYTCVWLETVVDWLYAAIYRFL